MLIYAILLIAVMLLKNSSQSKALFCKTLDIQIRREYSDKEKNGDG